MALVVGYDWICFLLVGPRSHTTSLLLLLCYEGLTAGHVLLDEGIAFARNVPGDFLPLRVGHVGQGHCENGDGNYK